VKAEFWHERWESNQLGFHQTETNPVLLDYWPTLAVAEEAAVFVPLCGKSLDMRWLRDRGHPITGIDLSPIAIRDFFVEAGLESTASTSSNGRNALELTSGGGYSLYCGDFFDLEPSDLASVRAVYDRASLIALPPEMRRRYAEHLTEILPDEVSILLITIEYDPSRMKGPPHSVAMSEVEALFAPAFQVEVLWSSGPQEPTSRFRERGLDSWNETAWRLHRGSAL
jgi:thiopurine S-methyltransferase